MIYNLYKDLSSKVRSDAAMLVVPSCSVNWASGGKLCGGGRFKVCERARAENLSSRYGWPVW